MLDKLKNLGFKYSTIAGITVSIADVVRSEKRVKLLKLQRLKLIKLINNIKEVLLLIRKDIKVLSTFGLKQPMM